MSGAALQVVLFDLDDTLFAHREAVRSGIVAHSALRGHRGEADALDRLWFELEERHYHSYLAGDLSFEGQRRARARDFAAAHGVELDGDASGAWFADYFKHYRAAWHLHADALPTLDALETAIPGVRFGIITNGEADFQADKIDRVALASRLEHVIASGALGVTKPDARIFQHAVEAFGVAPAAAVYVGDRLRTDALGAARAGLTGVWINRSGKRPSESDAAEIAELGVIEIVSLSELPALLA
ncbi:HAD family hydrolase [Agromyces atrinae]|uniref:HAD family hydrolase n=1 Tax=Agromyces atrinae TaxID=592376 RepID=UPI001F55B5C4|nr:HAD family hydrolase [Agromyces atrinae]MCI2959625.1 HAD family hydrolase [Agromyces atrinae]